jgi:hypothetical protein
MLVAIELVLLTAVVLQVQHLTAKSKQVPARVPQTKR